MKLKAVIFDVDGTLLDSLQPIIERHELTAKKLGLRQIERKEYIEHNGEGWEHLIHGIWPEADVQEFIKTFRAIPARPYPPFPGAVNAVKKVKESGLIVGALTGKPTTSAERQLPEAGFDKNWFSFIHGEQSVTVCKPDGRVFDNALTILGLHGITDKTQIAYVGDGLADLHASRDAGIKFIGVKTGTEELVGHEEECDYLLDTVAGVPEVIE